MYAPLSLLVFPIVCWLFIYLFFLFNHHSTRTKARTSDVFYFYFFILFLWYFFFIICFVFCFFFFFFNSIILTCKYLQRALVAVIGCSFQHKTLTNAAQNKADSSVCVCKLFHLIFFLSGDFSSHKLELKFFLFCFILFFFRFVSGVWGC